MKKIFIWTCVALTLFWCSACTLSSGDPIDTTLYDTVMDDSSAVRSNLYEMLTIVSAPQRSQSEVLAIASEFASQMSLSKNYSADEFNIDCILSDSELKKSLLKSSNAISSVDTVLFIVNQKDSAGFFIISGDKRLPDLLAYSPDGYLDRNNVDDNSGFAVFLSRLPDYYESSLTEFHEKLDSLKGEFYNIKSRVPEGEIDIEMEELRRYKMVFTPWVSISVKDNIVPVLWGQFYPYNNEAPLLENKYGIEERAVAGCVSIALAQLIATHKYPTSYQGINLNWDLLTKSKFWYRGYSYEEFVEYRNQVSRLLRKIGDRLGNSWGLAENGGTSARTSDIPNILQEMGYSTPSELTSYNFGKILESINQNKPVVLRGHAEKSTTGWFIFKKTKYRKGHAWISDGYLTQEKIMKIYDKKLRKYTEEHIIRRTLLHCNWGWTGTNNGYFNSSVFNSSSPTIEDSIHSDRNTPYFQYNVENILFVNP